MWRMGKALTDPVKSPPVIVFYGATGHEGKSMLATNNHEDTRRRGKVAQRGLVRVQGRVAGGGHGPMREADPSVQRVQDQGPLLVQ